MTAGIVMDARTYYWVPRVDCGRAQEAISHFLDTTTVMPATRHALREVLLELDLTVVREAVWPEGINTARLATGIGADILPILMNDIEAESLRAVPALPDSITRAIEGGPYESPSAQSPPGFTGV